MNPTPNAQYNVAKPNSLPVRIATLQRRKMFLSFLKECNISADVSVLDIGATSDQSYESSNYLEAWLENKRRITAVGIDDAFFLEALYPGLKYVRANGLNLPFGDATFDSVHSSAVIEHVGSISNQIQFISECARVAKKSFCITTPNRYFPIEFHTVLPLIHWLPVSSFRFLMRISGREFFSHEENLNLLSRKSFLHAAAVALKGRNFNYDVKSVKLFGTDSNLLLFAWQK